MKKPYLRKDIINDITCYHGDCLEVMKIIPDKSIDMILCDLPYGTTACKWDVIIPFEPLWEQYKRIIKDKGCIALFGSEPFSSLLITSNIDLFKYKWYWKKERGTGFSTANKRPLMIIEDIVIFYNNQPLYTPIKTKINKPYKHILPIKKGKFEDEVLLTNSIDNKGNRKYALYNYTLPHQLLEFSRDNGCRNSLHPTQKPVALLEYLIKTYTKEGETILDNCAGSGSTGVACKYTNRKGIMIEWSPVEPHDIYYNKMIARIKNPEQRNYDKISNSLFEE